MKQFAQGVLNTSGVRETLRQRVAQIDRLESLEGLKDLRLTGLQVSENNVCLIDYQAIASQELYPNVRARIIEKGVVTRNNIIRTSVDNKGQTDESEGVTFGVSGNSIQVYLKAYNPDYKE